MIRVAVLLFCLLIAVVNGQFAIGPQQQLEPGINLMPLAQQYSNLAFGNALPISGAPVLPYSQLAQLQQPALGLGAINQMNPYLAANPAMFGQPTPFVGGVTPGLQGLQGLQGIQGIQGIQGMPGAFGVNPALLGNNIPAMFNNPTGVFTGPQTISPINAGIPYGQQLGLGAGVPMGNVGMPTYGNIPINAFGAQNVPMNRVPFNQPIQNIQPIQPRF